MSRRTLASDAPQKHTDFPQLPGRYHVVRRIGGGGSADVYLAHDQAHGGRRIAVKVLRARLAPALVESFKREFRILASLEHPGIAKVHEFGDLGRRRAYYAADYVEGDELGAGGPLSATEAALAIAAVCRALAYVHSRGYLHNDVKPTNIRVGGAAETARLLDFGLAALAQTGSRRLAGTPGYIAPERLAGAASDARDDLYSVGATLYRVLSGRRVVDAEKPEEALALLRSGWTKIGLLRPDLPAGLVDLTERLLSLDASGRPRHAFEVIAALGEATGVPLPLETPGTSRCYALSSVFVGRQSELSDVEQTLRAAIDGGPLRVLAVAGGAGLGKSRLLREAVWRAQTSGWRVANTVCAERAGPLDPMLRLLAQLGRKPAPGAGDGEGLVAALLQAARSGPTLLVIDDAHNAADAAFHLAFALARSAASDGVPLAVLLAFDAEALAPDRRQRIAFSNASGELLRMELGSLTRGELQRVVDSLFGNGVIPTRLADAIAQRCGGNPLLLEETVREMVENGSIRSTRSGWIAGESARSAPSQSPRLEEFLRRRCGALPPAARAVLAALVSLGEHAAPEAVAGMTAGDFDAQVGMALLADHGLVTVQGGEIATAHPGLAAFAFERIAAAERKTLHRRAAEWLGAHGADDAELARAWREAGEARRAFDHAVRAGLRARDAGEGRRAASLLGEALVLADEAGVDGQRLAQVLVACAAAYGRLGRHRHGLVALERAYTLCAPSERGRVAAEAARTAIFAQRYDDAAEWLERAQAAIPENDPLAAALLALSAGQYASEPLHDLNAARARFEEGLRGLDEAAATGPRADQLRTRLLTALSYIEIHFDVGRSQVTRRAAADAAARSGDGGLNESAQCNLANGALQQGDGRTARAILTKVLDESERHGNAGNLLYLVATLAEAAHMCGAWSEAYGYLRRVELASQGSTAVVPALLHALKAQFAWHEGDLAAASRHADAALAGEDPALWREHLFVLLAVAASAAWDRAPAEAARLAHRAEAHARQTRAPIDAMQAKVVRAYAVVAVDGGRGAALLKDSAEALLSVGFRRDVPPILRDAARAFLRAGDVPSARACIAIARPLLAANECSPALQKLDELSPGEDQAWSIPGLVGAPRLHATPPDRVGEDEQCIPVHAGSTAAWLVVDRSVEPHALQPLLLGVRVALAALEGRLAPGAARPSAAKDGTAPPADAAEDSRWLELTLGPVELRHAFEGVVGRSPAMTRVLRVLDRLADSDAPVLLSGETGTGKEVFARALHRASGRAVRPFVSVNCSAVPAPLFEAELFGYRRGAFTGAVRDHSGLIREADGGTLLLDEVGDLPLETQPKLLRLLQERCVRQVGGDRETNVDIRLVTATNRDLATDIAKGRFRADLFYRINVVEIRLPPLRDRVQDIPELAKHLLTRLGHPETSISPKALAKLLDYEWPGNVRELENELQRAAILATEGTIDQKHLSARIRGGVVVTPTKGTPAERMRAAEREIVAEALARAKGNQTRAARALGLTRAGLFKKMRRLGLR